MEGWERGKIRKVEEKKEGELRREGGKEAGGEGEGGNTSVRKWEG